MRPSSVFDHTLFLGVYIGKSSTTYCLTKLARLSSPLWTQSATAGSLKLPRLKNPWSHGESNSSKKVWNKGVLVQTNWNFRLQEPFWWCHRPALPSSRLPPCLGCSWTPLKGKSFASENLLFSVSLLDYKERVDPKSTPNLGAWNSSVQLRFVFSISLHQTFVSQLVVIKIPGFYNSKMDFNLWPLDLGGRDESRCPPS